MMRPVAGWTRRHGRCALKSFRASASRTPGTTRISNVVTDHTIKTDIAAAKPAATVGAGFLPLLIALSGLGPMSMQAIMPALPALAAHFSQDISVAQLAISLYLVGLAFSQLVVGPLSDKFGRRPVILAGLFLLVLSNIGACLAVSLQQVIAARIVQALGAAAGLAVGRAMIRDLYDRDRAASMIGIVVGSMMIAPMLGPFFGGVLELSLIHISEPTRPY